MYTGTHVVGTYVGSLATRHVVWLVGMPIGWLVDRFLFWLVSR